MKKSFRRFAEDKTDAGILPVTDFIEYLRLRQEKDGVRFVLLEQTKAGLVVNYLNESFAMFDS